MSTDKNNKTDWVMVPREPTNAMIEALAGEGGISPTEYAQQEAFDLVDCYRAMIAAAPQPQPSRDREELRQQVAKMMQPWAWGSNTAVAETARNEALAKADAILSLTGVGFSARDHDLTASGETLWQPIATAPDDGQSVLLFCPEDVPSCVVGNWFSDPDWSGWQYSDELLSDAAPNGPHPTHWMPLPSPPETPAKSPGCQND